MPRSLYTPRLSDHVVRALYREAKQRRMPMTRLADELILQSLDMSPTASCLVREKPPDYHAGPPDREAA